MPVSAVQRDVVDDVVLGEIADGLTVDERAGDLLVVVRVVVEQPGRQPDGGMQQGVADLRPRTTVRLARVATTQRPSQTRAPATGGSARVVRRAGAPGPVPQWAAQGQSDQACEQVARLLTSSSQRLPTP